MASPLNGLTSFFSGLASDVSSVYKTVNAPSGVPVPGTPASQSTLAGSTAHPGSTIQANTILLIAGLGILVVVFAMLVRRRR